MEPVHEQVVELMPWYVNGTLTGPDRAAIEEHLRRCLPCRAAMREEQGIRRLVRAQDDVPLGASHGIADLLRRIGPTGGRSLPLWLRPQLGLGVAAVGVAITGWLVLSRPVPPGPGAPAADPARVEQADEAFTTLTDDGGSATNRIDIVLVGGIGQDEITALIESFGARLISGPSELGRYTVAVQAATEDELSDVIARLSSDPRVRFAGRNYSAPPAADSESR